MLFVVVAVVVFLCFVLFFHFPMSHVMIKFKRHWLVGERGGDYVKLHYGIALGVGYGPSFLRTFSIVTANERKG